jgi:hypothetical protein
MDEKVLFERMHDALDIELRPGAYERLRIALAKSPAKPHRWPVLRMGGSKMGFRLAAGLAVIVLAAAIVAAFLATHNATTGSVPAGSGQTIQAYQKLVGNDDTKANATWSSPCDTTTHTGCQADATRALVVLQQWLDDLNRSEPPTRFLVVDAQLRLHISGSISGLNALLAASQANDQNGMDRAYQLAAAGRAWSDAVVPSIVSSKQVSVTAYTNSVHAQSTSLTSCADCQVLAGQSPIDCSQNQTTCQYMLDGAEGLIANLQATLAAFAAPDSLSAKDTHLQQDLAQADSAVIAMNAAVSTGDQSTFNATRATLGQALAAVSRDAATI